MSRKVVVSLVVLIIIAGGTTGFILSNHAAPKTVTTSTGVVIPPKYVTTAIAHAAPFSEEIKLVGQVIAWKQTTISPQVSGAIKSVNVDVGSRVHEGDTLASIDFGSSTLGIASTTADTAYNNSIATLQSTKESASRDLESSRIALQTAKDNRDNTYASTDQQLKTATLQLQTAKDNRDNTYASTAKQVDIAKTQLDNAQSNRDNTIDITDKQLSIAQIQLDNIGTQKSNTIESTNEAVSSAQIGVDLATKSAQNAQTSLDNFEANSDATMTGLLAQESSLYDTARISLDSANTNIYSALNLADTILGVTDKNKGANGAYAAYLGSQDTSQLLQTKDQLRAALQAFSDFSGSEDVSSTGGVDNAITSMISLLNNVSDLYDGLTRVLNNTLPSGSFSATSLAALQASVTAQQSGSQPSSVQSMRSSFVTLKDNIINIKNTINSTLTNIDTSRASLQTALSISQTQLENAKQTLKSTQAGNNLNINTLSGSQNLTAEQLQNTIASIKSTRDNAEKSLELAKEQYDNALAGAKTAEDGVDNALKIAQAQSDSTTVAVKTARDNADSAVTAAETAYESTNAKLNTQITTTQTQLDASLGQKNMADVQVSNGTIRAPFDGVIITKNIEVGAAVSPATQAFTIGDDSQIIVRLDVNADNVTNLTVGQDVTVRSGTDTFPGSVSLVSSSADPTTRLFRVEVSFAGDMDSVKKSLNLGNYVDVLVHPTATGESVISVPFSAVMPLDQGEYRVYVVGSGSIAVPRSVKIGASNGTSVIIKEGLSDGERYIANGTLTVSEGDKIAELSSTGVDQSTSPSSSGSATPKKGKKNTDSGTSSDSGASQ